jgi:hypothetical protein
MVFSEWRALLVWHQGRLANIAHNNPAAPTWRQEPHARLLQTPALTPWPCTQAPAPDPATGARAVPIHLTTSFVFESSDHAASLFNLERAGHVYSAHQQPHQRGAGAARGGPGRRRRRHQPPPAARPRCTWHCHADGRGQPHRGQHGAVWRLAQPAALHAAPLWHRDHLCGSRATSTAGARRCAPTPGCSLAKPWATPAWRCWTSPRSRHRPRGGCAAAGGLHPHLALADQAVGAWRRSGLPLGHQVPLGPRHGDGRGGGGWRQL